MENLVVNDAGRPCIAKTRILCYSSLGNWPCSGFSFVIEHPIDMFGEQKLKLNKEQNALLNKELAASGFLRDMLPDLISAYEILVSSFEAGGKLLICGNGGSAADADHIVGELMKGFLHPRPLEPSWRKKLSGYEEGEALYEKLQSPLPAINLSAHSSLFTAFGNDVNFEMVFAQQVLGYGRSGDVLMAISTSGNSRNVAYAAVAAKAAGMHIITLSGENKGRLDDLGDIVLHVPEKITWKIQDMHGTVYHLLCILVEMYFWPDEQKRGAQ